MNAAAYSDQHLQEIGRTRTWVLDFWRDQLCETGDVLDDAQYVRVIKGIQAFVFGDVGDTAMGVDPQPATEAEVDGRLGPMTSRRMETWLDVVEEMSLPDEIICVDKPASTTDYLVVGGHAVYVDGGVPIVSLDESGNLSLGTRGSTSWGRRHPTMLGFGHWDVCTSAAKCHKVLKARKLASSGCFDNPSDGASTFYQFLDPGFRYGHHGGRTANRAAFFSFDLSNAVSKKYATLYRRKVGVDRPVLHMDSRERLGRGSVFLGMYAAQIHSLLYILKALSEHQGLPLAFPTRPDGTPVGRNYRKLWEWRGVATHRHLPKTTKWDVRGLEQQIVVMLLKDRLPMADFPTLVDGFRLHDNHWHGFLDRFERTCRWAELGIE